MSENALIDYADMVLQDINGSNGQQFVLELHLKTSTTGYFVEFNPLRLPKILQQLNLESFSELDGTLVQIMNTRPGAECKGIKSILAKESEDWIKTENDIYFGSNYIEIFDKMIE